MQTLIADLHEINYSRITRPTENYQRPFEMSEDPNKIKALIGLRRVGKSQLCLQYVREKLKQKKYTKEQILFLNFEDDRLLPMDAKALGQLIDSFYTLFPKNHERRTLICLDEIQNVTNWELVVRRIHDEKDCEILITGSSSKLLSKEIATSLRGRCRTYEVWPLDFKDYLKIKKIEPTTLGRITIDTLKPHLENYLLTGGLPEAVFSESPFERRNNLRDYVEIIAFKDLIERHNITSPIPLKHLIKKLLGNPSTKFSINKLYNDMRSMGLKTSKDNLYTFSNQIEDAFLAFQIPIYSENLNEINRNPKKTYAIDTGLAACFQVTISPNIGRLFENLVYLDCRRQHLEMAYYHSKTVTEIDFITTDIFNKKQLLQVCWDLSDPDTKKREEAALTAGIAETKLPGRLITPDTYFDWLFNSEKPK